MKRLWAHMRELWPRWTLLPAAPFVLLFVFQLGQGIFRGEILIVAFLAVFLSYWNQRTKRLMVVIYPLFLVGLLYEMMGPIKNLGLSEETVHVCDLHAAERTLFGVGTGASRMTLPDLAQLHPHPVLDVLSAIPYGTFLFVIVGYGFYLYFRSIQTLSRYAWTFFVLNVLGFTTYHLYPAAPPWYFHKYGCTVDLDAAASAGPNLLRVDQWMGFGFFEGFYGRSNDVFGAVPSLHVAYAVLILLAAWPLHRWFARSVATLYFVLMAFGAIYLDHHWVIDATLGIIYCVVVYMSVGWVQTYLRLRRAKDDDSQPDGKPA